MNTNKVILEIVEVVIKTKDSKTEIFKFKHKGKTYFITQQISIWKEQLGDNIVTHYHLICKDEKVSCQLSHNHKENSWMLTQMDRVN